MRCIRYVCRKQRLDFVFQSLKRSIRPYSSDCSRLRPSYEEPISGKYCSSANFVRKHMLESRRRVFLVSNSLLISMTSPAIWSPGHLRFYSSEGGGSNTGDNEVKVEKSKHADFGEQEQKEWLTNEQLALESQKNEPPFLSKREKFKYEFSRRIVPWEKITTTWESFPYFLDERTKNTLVECVSSRLRDSKFASDYGAQLLPSSGRILLQGKPGTELYRERLIKAVARDVKIPLLVLDGSVLAPFQVPVASGDSVSSSEFSKSEKVDNDTLEKLHRPLRKGDRIKEIPTGQRGEVYKVEEDRVAVILDKEEKDTSGEKDPKSAIHWLLVKEVELDLDAQAEDCYIAMEALCEVLQSNKPLIVYFVDSSLWLLRAARKPKRKAFVSKVLEMFDLLSGPVVLICGQNTVLTDWWEREKFKNAVSKFGRPDKLPLGLRRLTEGQIATKISRDIFKLFSNVICIHPPEDEDLLKTFEEQLVEDRRILISRSNLNELHRILEEHNLSCSEFLQVDTDGVLLTRLNAEQFVWQAKNNYLSTCILPSIKDERLILSRSSLEAALMRLTPQEKKTKKTTQNNQVQDLAEGQYEKAFVSTVVPPGEIGVQFDDVGALEDVKNALDELIILPMRRPDLFAHGNLLRPCKGLLLFGPPGTGKTLIAKALANEAGANFITLSSANLTSMWYGEEEKYTKALFTFASKLAKLAPVIIFIDEIDSMLGSRGGHEHEATRKMKNEFMTAWDGLRTNENQRLLILGATNRPFDIDDAVIRRMPRRILVDLPDAENRMKILKIQLAKENLETGFSIEELAKATEGYSGSDLKNLCMAAAYRPVKELLEEEKVCKETQVCKETASTTLRQLRLEDFIQSKSKVRASVAHDSSTIIELREWNERYGEGSRT